MTTVFIPLTQVISTDHGNEYKSLLINVDTIAAVSDEVDNWSQLVLNNGTSYIIKEPVSFIIKIMKGDFGDEIRIDR